MYFNNRLIFQIVFKNSNKLKRSKLNKKRYTQITNCKLTIFSIFLIFLHLLSIFIFYINSESQLSFQKKSVLTKKTNFTLNNFVISKNIPNSYIWKSLSELDREEILFTLDTLFPNLTNQYNKYTTDKSFIYDKNLNISSKYVDENKEWPDQSYIWETPNNQKLGSDVISGMKDIQHIIWKHQHPMTCNNKYFLIIPSLSNGLGSSLHIMSVYLGRALDEGKILAWGVKSDINS